MCPVLATFWCSYPRIPNFIFLSFLFLSPFLPLFLPLFLPSFIPSFLPFFLSPFHPFFLSFFLRCFLSSFIPSFLPCWLRSFCARNSLLLIPNIVRKFGLGNEIGVTFPFHIFALLYLYVALSWTAEGSLLHLRKLHAHEDNSCGTKTSKTYVRDAPLYNHIYIYIQSSFMPWPSGVAKKKWCRNAKAFYPVPSYRYQSHDAAASFPIKMYQHLTWTRTYIYMYILWNYDYY